MSALRFLVSLYIVVYHMLVVSPWDLRVVSPIFHKGWIGTDFFIILSGFIIAIAYKEKLQSKKLSPGDFMRGRLLRLWPPHAIIMMLFLCYFLLTKAAGFTTNDPSFFAPSAFVSQLFLTNSFIFTDQAWNVPTWTLSALLVCYAIYAFSIPYFPKVGSPHHILVGATFWLSAAAIVVFVLLGKSIAHLHEHLALVRAIPLFFYGAILGHFSLAIGSLHIKNRGTRAIFLVIFALIVAHSSSGAIADTIILLLTSGLVLLCCDLRSGRLMYALGRLSFAIYLLHVPMIYVYFPIIRRIAGLDRTDGAYITLWLTFPLIVVAAAYVFERFVERPLAKRLKPAAQEHRTISATA